MIHALNMDSPAITIVIMHSIHMTLSKVLKDALSHGSLDVFLWLSFQYVLVVKL